MKRWEEPLKLIGAHLFFRLIVWPADNEQALWSQTDYSYPNQQRKQRRNARKVCRNGSGCWAKNSIRKGFRFVVGLDEIGRGPSAGPVVAARWFYREACGIIGRFIVQPTRKREELFIEIQNKAVAIGTVLPIMRNWSWILSSSKNAMKRALATIDYTQSIYWWTLWRFDTDIPLDQSDQRMRGRSLSLLQVSWAKDFGII